MNEKENKFYKTERIIELICYVLKGIIRLGCEAFLVYFCYEMTTASCVSLTQMLALCIMVWYLNTIAIIENSRK